MKYGLERLFIFIALLIAAVLLNPEGNRIYAVSSSNHEVAVFDIELDGTLTQVGSIGSRNAVDIAFTPDGNYAYISDSTVGPSKGQ